MPPTYALRAQVVLHVTLFHRVPGLCWTKINNIQCLSMLAMF